MKIHELLSDESKWTQKAYARDKDGVALMSFEVREGQAVCWCLLGAIVKCYEEEERFDITIKIRQKLSVALLIDWNDNPERTYEDVIKVVRELDI